VSLENPGFCTLRYQIIAVLQDLADIVQNQASYDQIMVDKRI
jgi:hypothetical protein